MSYAVHRTALQASAVSHACAGNFLGTGTQIAVSAGNLLRIYEVEATESQADIAGAAAAAR